jgi:hypothetical protein
MHRAVKVAPGRILVDFLPVLVRTAFFAPEKVSTLSKVDEDAAAASKLVVEANAEGTSGSEVGHFVVGTAAAETGTPREVGIGAAESAAAVGAGGIMREGVVDAEGPGEAFTKSTGIVGWVIVRGG